MRKPAPLLFTPEPITMADAAHLTAILRAVADPARLQLLSLLHAHGEQSVQELMTGLGRLSQPTVSHHLHVLTVAGLVVRRKEGVFVMHRIIDGVLGQLSAVLRPGGGTDG